MPNTLSWSHAFAYAVGLLTTDGRLSCDGRHLDLTSKDLDQIENFREILQLKNKIGLKTRGGESQKRYYRIEFGDVKLYRFLEKIGLHTHKSKTIEKVKVPNEHFADFIRGVWDGDGFSYSYWDKRWKSS